MTKFTLLSAGSNARGQLGHSGDSDAYEFTPCRFANGSSESQSALLPGSTRKPIYVATGANHTLLLLERAAAPSVSGSSSTTRVPKREIWGCGDGRKGQLGQPYQVAESAESAAAIHGSDIFQPLDLPLKAELGLLSGYDFKLIAAGWETSYAVLSSTDSGESDVVISFGCNDFGDLGAAGVDQVPLQKNKPRGRIGEAAKKQTLHRVSFDHLVLDGTPIQSTDKVFVDALAASQHHVALLLRLQTPTGVTKRAAVGWGAARHGQLGLDSGHIDVATGKPIAKLYRPEVILVEDPQDPFVDVDVGSQHTVLLCASGRVRALGSNRKGQLAVDQWPGVKQAACSWNGTFALSMDGECAVLRGAGQDTHGQLGRGGKPPVDIPGEVAVQLRTNSPAEAIHFPSRHPGPKSVKLSCGTEHVLALLRFPGGNAEVWGWGWNEHGNLGVGHTNDVHAPTRIWPAAHPSPLVTTAAAVLDVWSGSGTSWILLYENQAP